MTACSTQINFNGFRELCEINKGKEKNKLDKTIEYCKKLGIDYKEFQRREIFGLIPISILNDINGTRPQNDIVDKQYTQIAHGIERPSNRTKGGKN